MVALSLLERGECVVATVCISDTAFLFMSLY